jgi:hypothetical protein
VARLQERLRADLHRLVLAVVGCVILTYAAMVVVGTLVQIPTAVVCDRRAPNTEVHITSTVPQGRFVKSHIGTCVLYTHVSRPVPGGAGGVDYRDIAVYPEEGSM